MQHSKLIILGLVAALIGACGMPRASDINPPETDETDETSGAVHPVWVVDARLYGWEDPSDWAIAPTEIPQFVKVLPEREQGRFTEDSH